MTCNSEAVLAKLRPSTASDTKCTCLVRHPRHVNAFDLAEKWREPTAVGLHYLRDNRMAEAVVVSADAGRPIVRAPGEKPVADHVCPVKHTVLRI